MMACKDMPGNRLVGLNASRIIESYDDLSVVGEAINREKAVFLAARLKPAVMIMHIYLPILLPSASFFVSPGGKRLACRTPLRGWCPSLPFCISTTAENPTKTHRPVEALRIALGLCAGDHETTIILSWKFLP